MQPPRRARAHPNIRKFIRDVVGRKNEKLIQEKIGYCLHKRYPIHRAFMLVGAGANGKSTLIDLIVRLLGKENTAAVGLHSLCNNRFAPAILHNKLANLCPDLPDKMIHRTGVFKTLTGGDIVQAEIKFKDPFTFRNFAKLIFSANKVPEAQDDTIAYYRRWIIIECPNTFSAKDLGGTKKANPKILDDICTPEELSGLLNWALEGLHRLLENGKFSEAKTWEEQRVHYIMRSNSAHAYIEACLEATNSFDDVIGYDELYGSFCTWCRTQKLQSVRKGDFTKNMGQHLPEAKEGYVRQKKKKQLRVWRYVRYKTSDGTASPTSPSSVLRPEKKRKSGISKETHLAEQAELAKIIDNYFKPSDGAKQAAERLKKLRNMGAGDGKTT